VRLQTKILATTAIIFLVHFLSVEYLSHRQVKQDVVRSLSDDARIIRGMLMSLRNVYQRQFLDHEIPINDKTLGFLPAHSISRISREFRDWVDTGLSFNNVSDVPRNPDNAADSVELEAIRFFRENQEQKERMVPYTDDRGEPYYHFSQPIWVKPRCLNCHGASGDAPPSIQERYQTAYNYKIGDLRGVMSIKLPARMIEQRVASLTRQNILSHSVGFLAAFLVLFVLLKRTLLSPISRLKNVALKLAAGNYQARAGVSGSDELAQVANIFDQMADQISQREKALTVQKSLYEALSETNKSIIRLDSPQLLFESVCQIAAQHGGLKFAWIGLTNSETGIIEAVASAGETAGCLQQTRFSLDPKHPQGGGPVSVAAREARPVVVNDVRRDPMAGPWHALARREGIGSVAVFPIFLKGEVTGTFSIYADKPGYFSEEIISLLDEMTGDIVFAIHNYQLTDAHDRAHEQLEKSSAELEKINRQMTLLLESTGEGIFGVDTAGRCIFVNRAALQILGFTREELIGQSMHELTHHSHADGSPYHDAVCPIYGAFRTGKSCRIQNELFWCRDGTSFPVEYSAYPIHEGNNITGAVTVFRDVSESHAMARKMSYLATHDTLTNLLNRYAFEQQLAKALEAVRQDEGMRYALCYMDLDQFKVVNDTCGHVAGDAMLQMIAHLIQHTVRQNDILARLGGDEFALLLENCSLEQAESLSQKICDVVKEFRFTWHDKHFTSGISIGVVGIDWESESSHSLLSAADSACYLAKEMGRNRVYVRAEHDDEVARRQGEMQWVSEIQSAIEEQRLFLHYQPIVSLGEEGAQGTHFELLLRMKGRDGQNIPPGAFIPAAERYDLMQTLDRWVINTAFSWLTEHPAVVERIDFFSINLSGQSLGDERLHEYIVSELSRSGLAVEKVCFEITETAAVSRLDQAINFISRLKRLGCRFALDDFGTGMSSFAYLKNLPVDFLKIDGSFVKDIVSDPIDRAMVVSINEIGHLMGLQTIAEYVENDAIRKELSALGVDYAQGFGISRPGPLDSLLWEDDVDKAS